MEDCDWWEHVPRLLTFETSGFPPPKRTTKLDESFAAQSAPIHGVLTPPVSPTEAEQRDFQTLTCVPGDLGDWMPCFVWRCCDSIGFCAQPSCKELRWLLPAIC